MKQKRMFKRQRERHPFKWCVIATGLLFLSFASFGAGVQFATLTLDPPDVQMADSDDGSAEGSALEATAGQPLRVSHKPGQDT